MISYELCLKILINGVEIDDSLLSPTPVFLQLPFEAPVQFLLLFTRLTFSYPFLHTFLHLSINTHY